MNGPPKTLKTEKGDVVPIDLKKGEEAQQAVAREREFTARDWYSSTALELSKNPEGFPFPGIDDESYAKLKKEGCSYVTPIDDLIARFQKHGMKVVISDTPGNLDVFILPKDSDDIIADSVFPRHLNLTDDMNPKLRMIIFANKEYKKANS